MSIEKEGFGPVISKAISAYSGNVHHFTPSHVILAMIDAGLFDILLQQTGAKFDKHPNLGAQENKTN